MACQARCRAVLRVPPSTGRRTTACAQSAARSQKSVRARVRIALPRRARAALSAGRPITVRLRLTATMGTRVIMARRTVRIAAPRR
jgi:hypothetical protein